MPCFADILDTPIQYSSLLIVCKIPTNMDYLTQLIFHILEKETKSIKELIISLECCVNEDVIKRYIKALCNDGFL